MAETSNQEIIDIVTEQTLESGIQHVNNPVLDLPQIVKKYLERVTSYQQKENSYLFTDGSATVEVKVVSDEIIRVRLAPHGQFLDDFSYAVPNPDQHVALYAFQEEEDCYIVSTNTV